MAPIRHFDVIVVGLGTAGSATCMELARRGIAVLGLDAFAPPHTRASHHGESRSIRRAYMEGTTYVPMAMRAWDLWRRLEQDTGQSLLIETANLTIGPPDAPAIAGFLKSARSYHIPFEYLTALEVRARWPQLHVPSAYTAGLEIQAGIVFSESAVRTFLGEADRAGAVLHVDEPVLRWEEMQTGIRVHTAACKYDTGRLLLAAGAGNTQLMTRSGTPLTVKRVPVCWVTAPRGKNFKIGSFPVNFWQIPEPLGDPTHTYREIYALPVTRSGGKVKVAPHNGLADADPDHPVKRATAREINNVRTFMAHCIPELAGQKIQSEVCLYTVTPDRNFWLGLLPGHEHVFITALSGHGFKFAPVLGEILADMLEGSKNPFHVAMFDPARPA